MMRGGKKAPSVLKVAGNESAHDEVDGRSLLDEIAREGPRWRPRSPRTWRRITTNETMRGHALVVAMSDT
jgi:hypothetical protein